MTNQPCLNYLIGKSTTILKLGQFGFLFAHKTLTPPRLVITPSEAKIIMFLTWTFQAKK